MRDAIVNIAVQAARAAGNIIMRATDRLDMVKVTEKNSNDFFTEIDQLAEKEIISVIRKAHPNHSILGEQSGEIAGNDTQWIIDPIDGTRNFFHGFPHFAVSIAISFKNVVQQAVIYDPVRQDLFTASRGKGAQLNERRLRVSTRSQLEECMLGTNFPHHYSPEHRAAYIKSLQELTPMCSDIRRSGCTSLDLAYVAAGRLDGFWGLALTPWDVAGGALFVQEAGGIVCDTNGGEEFLKTGNIVAGNPKILKLLLKAVKPHLEL